ncbi:unnamed protein product [Cuscuta campestris]|uniref:Uncharacterized protein n=1 Tax=Cuscuta campestris TaxID=132261 RepID=A0A484KEV0_9ASTE|nr:unnamed protein product [Cuscuta campestris]
MSRSSQFLARVSLVSSLSPSFRFFCLRVEHNEGSRTVASVFSPSCYHQIKHLVNLRLYYAISAYESILSVPCQCLLGQLSISFLLILPSTGRAQVGESNGGFRVLPLTGEDGLRRLSGKDISSLLSLFSPSLSLFECTPG